MSATNASLRPESALKRIRPRVAHGRESMALPARSHGRMPVIRWQVPPLGRRGRARRVSKQSPARGAPDADPLVPSALEAAPTRH